MTQLNDEQLEQLSNEINRGELARKYYETFVEPFVTEKRNLIFQAFMEASPSDAESLSELRRMISIVNIFDHEIKTYMETGQMAQMSINEADKH